MFEGKSFFEILSLGGWTLYILFIISIISVSIIILKIIEFRGKAKVKTDKLLAKVKNHLMKGSVTGILDYCQLLNSPVANTIIAGLVRFSESGNSDIEEAMRRTITKETVKLEKYTTVLATIGAISVYIGLFGTVLGIIRSFHDISLAGSGGISVVIGGVSESLIATAAGLSVAIPAVAAYNFFTKAIDNFVVEMEYTISALKEILDIVIKTGIARNGK
ncbi:MAG: MotA/TolQ/ExbB proton channel family protein [Endomicrobiaceae bacterium]|nr:MotA/TolQ/ExbB proton channel family protein [Endomicrobiaceae bacterium]